jgi:hypothetical protein
MFNIEDEATIKDFVLSFKYNGKFEELKLISKNERYMVRTVTIDGKIFYDIKRENFLEIIKKMEESK